MNGETQLSIKLIRSLNNREVFEIPDYIESINFEFMKRRLFFSKEKATYDSWQDELVKRHFKKAYIVLPVIEKEEWKTSGFANGTRQGICIDYGSKDSLWISIWEYNEVSNKWRIHYKEHEMMLFKQSYCLELNISAYEESLIKIADLANEIGELHWEKLFRESKEFLTDESLSMNERINKSLAKSSVFGGMGSWGDSPPYSAHQKGLSKEFDVLTAELYDQRKRILMMLINND